MVQDTNVTTFVALVSIKETDIQNTQELSALWGRIRGELEELGITVLHSYAVLGDVDFIVTYETSNTHTAFQAGIVFERHGLDAQSMVVTAPEHFAELVEDA